jgi:crotonobetainyl-CoA:carnitine CoA-transferase CaiB-like acyl-CoA transferase
MVYCSISGVGQTGPRRDAPGYDSVVQAEGGLMSITGHAEMPPVRLGVAIGDMAAGLYAAFAIVTALFARVRSGRGQFIDVGMLDSVASLLTYQAGLFFADGTEPRRMGNRHPTIAPYDTFPTADGEFVLAVGNDEQWQRLCAVMKLDTLASDERFTTNKARVLHYDILGPLLIGVFRTLTRDECIRLLLDAGVPCGAVRTIPEVMADPQLAARDMIVPLQHGTAGTIRVLGIPPKLSDTPGEIRTPPPMLGEQTDAILRELGFDEDRIAALRRSSAI